MLDKKTANANIRLGLMLAIAVGLLFIGTIVIGLVVGVILLFLRKLWGTVIPAVSVPMSLIGTFTVLAAMGYSLNTLSLYGQVLAIGIVEDDASVVVENER